MRAQPLPPQADACLLYTSEYNLSLQGGNAKTTQFLSLGYLKDEGILRHTDFEHISARANTNHTVNKFLNINGNLAYARAEKNAGQSQNASLSNYSNAFMFYRRRRHDGRLGTGPCEDRHRRDERLHLS